MAKVLKGKKALSPHARRRRRGYSRPVLFELGNLRDVTLAPSPAPEFESGRGLGFRAS